MVRRAARRHRHVGGVYSSNRWPFRPCSQVELYSVASSADESCTNGTSKAFGIASLGLYGLGGPVAHATHDHWDKAALSVGIGAMPIVIGLPLASSGSGAAPFILIGGTLTAMIIDDAVLANDEVPPKPTWSLTPTFDPRGGSGAIALAHAF